MKKNQFEIVPEFISIWNSKLVLTLKLTVTVLCFTAFQGFALIIYGQNAKVNLKYEIDNRQIQHSNLEDNLSSATQQQKTVTGKIVDSTGGSLPGVSVVIKGTNVGTITNSDGKYSISNIPSKGILHFSFVGMKSQEFVVGDQTIINVTLADETIGIEEVVAVGYGTQKKSDITGALVSVKSEELKQMPTQRVDQALQGRSAGVMVLNTDGAPGGNTVIRIRGLSSITGSNAALIVIDGQQGGNLNTLDPNDIESMEVLKDASSTAIYGSKGANGVILITTRSGKKGKPVVSYSYNYGMQKLRRKLPVMSSGDFARTLNAYFALNNLAGTPSPYFTDQQISDFDRNGGTDWQDEIYQVAPMQSHSLSLGGATDNVSYFFSGGYLKQDGIVINSGYNRLNTRLNITANVNKWISMGLIASYVESLGSAPPFGGNPIANTTFENSAQPILQAPLWSSTIPVYDATGNYSRHPSGFGNPMAWNPVAIALETEVKNLIDENRVNGYLDFKILKGLSLRVIGSMIVLKDKKQVFSNEKTFNGRMNNGKEGEGVINSNNYKQLQNTNILTYDREIGKHHLTFTGVAEQQIEGSEWSSTSAIGFTNVTTGLDDIGGAATLVLSSGAYDRVLNSYLGRVNYSFASKYLFTASYRADGSSVFGKNNKWGYFPSAAIAWRITEENFMTAQNIVSDLKLRASYGTVGNQAISPYQSMARLSSGMNYPYNGTENTDLGYQIRSAANPNLKWESTSSGNIGLDYGLFEGRLAGSIDVYQKKTTNLLLYRNLGLYTGLNNVIDNIGSSENKGLELTFKGDPFVGSFKWNTGFNISWNRNKIIDMGTTKELEISSTSGGYGVGHMMWLRPGEPFGQMLGYKTLGCWKESERAEAAKYGQLPGTIHYEDLNKDGKVNLEDRQVIGNAFPKYIYGWSNHFSYKGFDLNVFIQGVQGNDIFNEQEIRRESPAGGSSPALLNRWTIDNQNSDVPAFIDAKTSQNANLTSKVSLPSTENNSISKFVEDGSYLRVKNLTLAYTIPSSIVSKAGISKLRVYLSGTNLITLTKYTGYDPEVSSFKDNDASFGIDLGNYPPAKTYTFGVEVSF